MTNKKQPLTRGRPRTFDEQAVLARATEIFLETGFEAVSYEQLAKDVGLSKPSLYNAFGDKPALFERVLENYASQAVMFCLDQFEQGASLHDGVNRFLTAAAELYAKPDAPSQGCLLVGTALPSCTQLENIRQTLATFIQSLEEGLDRIIKTKFDDDAQMLKRSPKSLSMTLSSLLFSLAIRARAGLSKRELCGAADELIATFPKPSEL